MQGGTFCFLRGISFSSYRFGMPFSFTRLHFAIVVVSSSLFYDNTHTLHIVSAGKHENNKTRGDIHFFSKNILQAPMDKTEEGVDGGGG